MYASTGDERLKQKGEALVAGLAVCQAKFPSGYLSAYPEEFFDRVEKQQQVWAPYYTLHKIFAGLLDMYVLCGDQQALEIAKKFGDWVIARNSRLTDPQMQAMLGNEHGGMNECLANLYALTGEEKYLAISKRFNHQAVIGPAMLGNHRKDFGVSQENLAHFSRGRLAVFERERDGHGSADPKVAFFQMRKKLAAESRCDQEECSQRKGQFNSYHEDAVFQGKTQSRIVDTVQQADDDCFGFLHVLGEQQGSDHGRDGECC